MRVKQLTILAAAVVAVVVAQATPARALATTTFVSGFGLDTNPCTAQNPCRSFQHAHDLTAAGGQITMLDAAGYGAVTITKAISIVNDGGGEAGINDPGPGDAITINAGAGDVVNLRGLTLNDVAVGHNGITFNTGGALNIQNCVIRAFGNFGVFFAPSASAAITITDTIFPNNSSGVGILPSSGTVTASLERVTVVGSSVNGILFDPSGTGTIQGTITDSAAIRNTSNGFFIATGAAAATVALINSEAIANGVGVRADTGTIVMSEMTIAGNTTDGFVSASLESFGDNYIIDATNSGALTPILLQ